MTSGKAAAPLAGKKVHARSHAVATSLRGRVKTLEREVRELRQTNEIDRRSKP